MQKPEAVVTAILNRWANGQLNDEQLGKQLQGCGWTRREVAAYLERADAMAEERAAFQARSQASRRPDAQARDFVAERRATLERQGPAAAILERWRREEIGLTELLRQLQAAGWSRRDCFAYLEREADEEGRRQAENRSKPAGLQN